jgi:hypothetical protein
VSPPIACSREMSLPEEVTIVLGPGTQPGQQFRLHHADGIRVLTHYGGEPVLYKTPANAVAGQQMKLSIPSNATYTYTALPQSTPVQQPPFMPPQLPQWRPPMPPQTSRRNKAIFLDLENLAFLVEDLPLLSMQCKQNETDFRAYTSPTHAQEARATHHSVSSEKEAVDVRIVMDAQSMIEANYMQGYYYTKILIITDDQFGKTFAAENQNHVDWVAFDAPLPMSWRSQFSFLESVETFFRTYDVIRERKDRSASRSRNGSERSGVAPTRASWSRPASRGPSLSRGARSSGAGSDYESDAGDLDDGDVVETMRLGRSMTRGNRKRREKQITVHVRAKLADGDISTTEITMAPSAPFERLIEIYLSKHRLHRSDVKFVYGEQVINGDKTPQQLGLGDGGELDAWHDHGPRARALQARIDQLERRAQPATFASAVNATATATAVLVPDGSTRSPRSVHAVTPALDRTLTPANDHITSGVALTPMLNRMLNPSTQPQLGGGSAQEGLNGGQQGRSRHQARSSARSRGGFLISASDSSARRPANMTSSFTSRTLRARSKAANQLMISDAGMSSTRQPRTARAG